MTTRITRTLAVASFALVLACGDDSKSDGDSGNSGDAEESGTMSDSAEGSDQSGGYEMSEADQGDGDGDQGDGDGDNGDGDGDQGDGDGDGGDGDGDNGDGDGEPNFCDQVDFLFVIDNSISMLPEQDALKAAFPGFIAAIEDSLDTDDHILITDTDLQGWCTFGACNGNPNNLHPTCEGQDSFACTMELEECDITLGAGVDTPAGQEASNEFCDPFGGNRYIVEDDPNKVDTFSCMASVGLAGFPDERPLDAIKQAVSDPLNNPGGCNEGFLRDDAILVITFISDDDENNETNTPQEVFDAVLAAKNDDLDRIVTLGLIPSENNNCSFTPGAGDHWLEFIQMFGEQGIDGPSCAEDYVEFFQDAVDVIVTACENNGIM